MLDRPQPRASAAPRISGHDCMAAAGDEDKARRFRDAVLPCLDDAFTLARYLMRNETDAEDAVQECYLRALRHFDSYRGPAIKPWLFASRAKTVAGELSAGLVARPRLRE